MRSLSLKYRIALIIFVLAGAMMMAVLWLSLSLSLSSGQRELAAKEHAFLRLLEDACRMALVREEFMDLQPYVEGLRQEPVVDSIILADHKNRVVVSTDPTEVGHPMPTLHPEGDHVWRTVEITNPAGTLGTLAIRFSETSLKREYHHTRSISILVAAVGIAFMAFIGLWLGGLLTKRLDSLAKAAQQMAKGNLSVALAVDGTDEVAELNRLFNSMANQLETNIKDLKDRAEYIRALMNNTLDAIITMDEQGTIELTNPAAEKIFGYPAAELIGTAISSLLPGLTQKQGAVSAYHALTAAGKTAEMTAQRKDGASFPVELSVSEMCLGSRCVAIAIIRDTTDRKQAEEALRRSEESFHAAFEYAPIGMALVGLDERFLLINQALCSILGYRREDLLQKTVAQITHPDDIAVEAQQKSAVDGKEKHFFLMEKRYLHADGHVVWGRLSVSLVNDTQGKPLYFIGQMEDITDRKKTEEEKQKLQSQLLHIKKMEAVGQLAGGIAHDFNNILTAIIGYGNIILMKSAADNPMRPHVDQILGAAQRAANLTQGLLAFSRKQVIDPKPVVLNTVIERVETLLHRLIGEDIVLRTDLTDKETLVLADSGQIEQILMNLATNGRDAMPNGGDLTIRTEHAEIDENFIRTHGYGKKGRYVTISISDTGFGMDESTQQRIFDPFFTTKEVGKGTGLGLAIIYGIVKQHHGYIHVASEPGQGTMVMIYLPLIETAATPAAPLEPAAPLMGGTETILLAEDDFTLRKLQNKFLGESGYTVIEAVDGQDAIEKLRLHRDKIDLLITDVIMPRKNGKEVYNEAKQISPQIKTLFISGYPAEIIQQKGILEEGLHFIYKPVSPQELLRHVRSVLDQ